MQLMTESEIRAAVSEAMDEQAVAMAAIDSTDLCNNKELIMGFLNILVGLLPGWIGKLVGQVLITAAESWFERHCA